MTVQKLLKQVRYQINDTDKAEYTDDELVGYVNDALRFISNELIKIGSSLLLKKATLTISEFDGSGLLPDDFVKEQAVVDSRGYTLKSLTASESITRDGYKIIGRSIYADKSNSFIELYYYSAFQAVSTLEEELSVPDYMIGLVKEIVVFMALNRNEFLVNVESELIKVFHSQIVQLANIGKQNLEFTLPFVI